MQRFAFFVNHHFLLHHLVGDARFSGRQTIAKPPRRGKPYSNSVVTECAGSALMRVALNGSDGQVFCE